jgi:hypothetical protein
MNVDLNFFPIVDLIIIYIQNFYFDFLETLNTVFNFFKKQAH